MEVEYIKGLGCPVNIIWGKEATAITITDAKQLQAKLAQVIEQAEDEPETELSEFEKALEVFLMNADSSEETFHEEVKKHAAELLSLARDQFIKDGYVIEKKAFHDAVEKIDDKNKAEMSIQYSLYCNVEDGTRHAVINWKEFQKLAQKFIDIGKNEALKDLPRWKKWENGAAGNSDGHPIALVSGAGGIRFVSTLGITGEKYIMLADLKELPGFKEDEKWK